MSHPLYQLGRKKARIDNRTFTLKSIMAKPLDVPKEYSFDTEYPGIPLPMFANDIFGCCVISGRAHQTLRFERIEQSFVIKITDKDVVNEYFKETGGADSGLVMLDSLNSWRRGWKIGRKAYRIKAFAAIDPKSKSQLMQTVYSDVGAYVGLDLPLSAQEEFDAGKPWSKTTGIGTTVGSWGGHCVFVVGYTSRGPVCITWGQRQACTWAWFRKYCSEAYAVIDSLNTSKKVRLFSYAKLVDRLAAL